jgi:Ca2+-binding EF-hand superfamily protein
LEPKAAAASSPRRTKLKEGDKVEANYRGRGKFYPGRIRRDREDGTYDIDYDDGEAETRVKEDMIRSLEPKAAADLTVDKGVGFALARGSLLSSSEVEDLCDAGRQYLSKKSRSLSSLVGRAADRDGRLSFSNFRECFVDIGVRLGAESLRKLFTVLDVDGSDSVRQEYVITFVSGIVSRFEVGSASSILLKLLKLNPSKLRAFCKRMEKLDARSSGFVDSFEVKHFFTKNFPGALSVGEAEDISALFESPKRKGEVDYIFAQSVINVLLNISALKSMLSIFVQTAVPDIFDTLYGSSYRLSSETVQKELAKFCFPQPPLIVGAFLSTIEKGGYVELQTLHSIVTREGMLSSTWKKFGQMMRNSLSVVESVTSGISSSFAGTLHKKLLKIKLDQLLVSRIRCKLLELDKDLSGLISKTSFAAELSKLDALTQEEVNLLIENVQVGESVDYLRFLGFVLDDRAPDTLLSSAKELLQDLTKDASVSDGCFRLFQVLANHDKDRLGRVPLVLIEDIAKARFPSIKQQSIAAFFARFQGDGGIRYLEAISTLKSAYWPFLISSLVLMFDNRAKQGYDVKKHMKKYFSRDSRRDLNHLRAYFVNAGILLPEVSLGALFDKVSEKGDKFSLEKLSDLLNAGEAQLDRATESAGESVAVAMESMATAASLEQFVDPKEQEQHQRIMQAALFVFSQYELNNSGQISVMDLEKVVFSTGYRITADELDAIVSDMDKSRTGLISLRDFVPAFSVFCGVKNVELKNSTPSRLRQFFDYFDANGDGLLQRAEFAHVLRSCVPHLLEEHIDELMDFLDVDHSQDVSWDEFSKLFNESAAIPRKIAQLLESIRVGSLPEPEKSVGMFVGLPSNYRVSIFGNHYYPSTLGMEKLICNQDEINFANQLTFQVALMRIHGIPNETSKRKRDILNRGVKFSVCYLSSPPSEESSLPSRPVFLTNVCKLNAKLHDKHEDKWVFHDEDHAAIENNCMLRCDRSVLEEFHNHSDGQLTDRDPAKGLYLYLELFSSVNISANYKVSPRGVVRRDASEAVETTDKQPRDDAETNIRSRGDLVEEMCCGWALIPLAAFSLPTSGQRVTVPISGGTPFCFVKIREDDIKKRTGTWQMIKRSLGYKISSTVEMSIAVLTQTQGNGDTSAAPNSIAGEARAIDTLPRNIILPSSSFIAVALFRHILHESGLQTVGSAQKFISQQNSIILSNFPLMMADRAALEVFVWAWRELLPKSIQPKLFVPMKDITGSRASSIFATLMLHMWNVRNLHGSRRDSISIEESYSEIERRRHFMKGQVQARLSLGTSNITGDQQPTIHQQTPETLHAPFNVKEFRVG